ncbi:uncharacterized protein LOC110304432 [Mus caroli]|uniref:Uncharacterized protein LOC110304432 n=1 Tax=Mus caroli TaxID=10089 RepID=A0A6P5QKX9_MUSCR|nr:uncharacterized protein LOC110304432 [Mus caroli]
MRPPRVSTRVSGSQECKMREALGAELARRLQKLGLARHLNAEPPWCRWTEHQPHPSMDHAGPGTLPHPQPSASPGSPERYAPRRLSDGVSQRDAIDFRALVTEFQPARPRPRSLTYSRRKK